MRICLSVLFAGILGSMMLAGGCVPQEKYDALRAQNLNAQAELARVMELLNQRERAYKALETQLAEMTAQLKAKDDQIAILSQGKDGLLARIKELEAALKAAHGDMPKPPTGMALNPKVNKAMEDLAAKYPKLLKWDPVRGMMKFASDLTFDPGDDTVKDQAKEALTVMAEIINSPEAATLHAYIAGHTDDIPISKEETKRRHPTNWYLSVHRSVSVEKLLEKDGVAGARLAAMGFGENHPVAPNAAGHKGNVANRRVEIWFIPPERFLTVEQDTSAPAPAPAKAEAQ